MARALIVGGGCRGRALAQKLIGQGHAVRISTRSEAGRPAIEAVGAECWVGTPHAIGTLRYALENVTVLCWLLASARGAGVAALHGSRLQMMLSRTIDTTVRGVTYEARGTLPREILEVGAELVTEAGRRSGIPVALIDSEPSDRRRWLERAHAAVEALLAGAGAAAAAATVGTPQLGDLHLSSKHRKADRD